MSKRIEADDSVDTTFLNRQLENLERREDGVKAHLEQLDFDASRAGYRVTPVDEAVAPKVPTNNRRLEYMAAAPIAVFLALIGLALLSPIKRERAWTEV